MALLILLKKKILSANYNNNAVIKKENYAYNIRGWLPGVNRDYVKDGNSNNYFGFDLGYDKSAFLELIIPLNLMAISAVPFGKVRATSKTENMTMAMMRLTAC